MRLIDHLRRASSSAPARSALVENGNATSWSLLTDQYERIAATLAEMGITQGTPIGIYSPNSSAAFTAMLGIIRLGGVWVPINVRNSTYTNRCWINLTQCKVLFYAKALEQEVCALRSDLQHSVLLVCLDGPAVDGTVSLGDFTECPAQAAPEPSDAAETIVNFFPTGGTTGLSKAVRWDNSTWNALLRAYTACLGAEPPNHLVAAPLTHAAGVMALAAATRGGTNIILPDAEPKRILDAIEHWQVTHLYLPPTVVYKLLAEPGIRARNFSSLKHFLVAASPIAPAKLQEAMDVFGDAMCQSFGQAEVPMFITYLSNEDLRGGDAARLMSCGRPTCVAEVAIMDQAGTLLASGERGEIVVRGDLVAPGYLENPQADAAAGAHGWHHTGDIGYVDQDGFVYIVDRLKDMIITGGFNVYSAEVEQVILEHPAVLDCAVIGVPDSKWGEAIKAVVELKAGVRAEPGELIRLVRERLGPVQTPKTLEIWDVLPRSPAGKILKKEVRARYWEGAERHIS